MSEFKKYPKRPEIVNEYPLCECGHFYYHHEVIEHLENHGFKYSKKDLGDMLMERHEWSKTHCAECERCECPKFNFKENMTMSKWYDLGLNK